MNHSLEIQDEANRAKTCTPEPSLGNLVLTHS